MGGNNNNGKVKRRILHTSDLHLEVLGDKGCHGLTTVTRVANRMKVDLVIIAGDLFDHNRVKDALVNFVAEELNRLTMPAVLLPGNHDCLTPEGVYLRDSIWKQAPNVRLLKSPEGETAEFNGLGISVWGKAITDSDYELRPLTGVPQPQDPHNWHIAIAHGYFVEPNMYNNSSLPITTEEILACKQDYIALGHWPAFRCICETPKTYYCDSPSYTTPTVNIVQLASETGVTVIRHSLKDEPKAEDEWTQEIIS